MGSFNLADAKWGTLPKLNSQGNSSSIKAPGHRLIKGLWLRSNYPSPAPKPKGEKNGGKGEKRGEAVKENEKGKGGGQKQAVELKQR